MHGSLSGALGANGHDKTGFNMFWGWSDKCILDYFDDTGTNNQYLILKTSACFSFMSSF